MTNAEYPDLTTFKALSFDCYGTLIDWETGILPAMRLITTQLPANHPMKQEPPHKALQRFDELTVADEVAHPTRPYNEIMAGCLLALAEELGAQIASPEATAFGNSVGSWLPFPDTIEGLQRLSRRYKLIILSNVDNANICATTTERLAPARFDAVYTAQDIGSYKPSLANFRYLYTHARDELGVDADRGELLHVACSLRADHVPAKEVGLRSAWISRGVEADGQGIGQGDEEKFEGKVAYEWKFTSIGEFTDEVERQFAAKGL
ncbi:HAD-like domain-containing protein [Xylariales sp. PMI_506]|nr:HAD-like domain-containing protein [Xylariales sp. PMI_506]